MNVTVVKSAEDIWRRKATKDVFGTCLRNARPEKVALLVTRAIRLCTL